MWSPFANVVFKNNFLSRRSCSRPKQMDSVVVLNQIKILEPDVNNSPFVDKFKWKFSPLSLKFPFNQLRLTTSAVQ